MCHALIVSWCDSFGLGKRIGVIAVPRSEKDLSPSSVANVHTVPHSPSSTSTHFSSTVLRNALRYMIATSAVSGTITAFYRSGDVESVEAMMPEGVDATELIEAFRNLSPSQPILWEDEDEDED